jgi:hypothetical protein
VCAVTAYGFTGAGKEAVTDEHVRRGMEDVTNTRHGVVAAVKAAVAPLTLGAAVSRLKDELGFDPALSMRDTVCAAQRELDWDPLDSSRAALSLREQVAELCAEMSLWTGWAGNASLMPGHRGLTSPSLPAPGLPGTPERSSGRTAHPEQNSTRSRADAAALEGSAAMMAAAVSSSPAPAAPTPEKVVKVRASWLEAVCPLCCLPLAEWCSSCQARSSRRAAFLVEMRQEQEAAVAASDGGGGGNGGCSGGGGGDEGAVARARPSAEKFTRREIDPLCRPLLAADLGMATEDLAPVVEDLGGEEEEEGGEEAEETTRQYYLERYTACTDTQLRRICAASWLSEAGDRAALLQRLMA